MSLIFSPISLPTHLFPSREFESIVASLSDALDFSRTIGLSSGTALDQADFYTSHEGLLLDYERALTRSLPVPGTNTTALYNTSAHFVWIGDRTRQVDGDHVAYFRTIRNPIGVKVGPTMADDELIKLLDSELLACLALNPSRKPFPSPQSGQGRGKSDAYYAVWRFQGRSFLLHTALYTPLDHGQTGRLPIIYRAISRP